MTRKPPLLPIQNVIPISAARAMRDRADAALIALGIREGEKKFRERLVLVLRDKANAYGASKEDAQQLAQTVLLQVAKQLEEELIP